MSEMQKIPTSGSSTSIGSRRMILENSLKYLDRWGDRPKRETTVVGGILGCFMVAAVGVYGALSAIGYLNKPLEIATEVKWSASFGPYPMEFKCYYDACWLSVEYSTQLAIKGQSYQCAKTLEARQANRCHEFKHDEVISISSCYSQLPHDGLRLHFSGRPHWNNDFGLDGSDGQNYGLTIASDMNGKEGQPYPMPTPIRAGLHIATYVHTINKTLADDTPGSSRNEWFLQEVSTDIPARYLTGDGCASMLSSKNAELLDVKDVNGSALRLCSTGTGCSTTALKVHTAVLTMAPWFTEATVNRERLWTSFLEYTGELGGISAMFDIVLLGLTWAYYYSWRRWSASTEVHASQQYIIARLSEEVRELTARQSFLSATSMESSSLSSPAEGEDRLSQVVQQVGDHQAMLRQQSLQLEELEASHRKSPMEPKLCTSSIAAVDEKYRFLVQQVAEIQAVLVEMSPPKELLTL